MPSRYAARLALETALRLGRNLPRTGRGLRELSGWAEECELGLGWKHQSGRGRWDRAPAPDREALVTAIKRVAQTYARARRDEVACNLDVLADWLALDPVERDCVALIARAERSEPLAPLLEIVTEKSGMSHDEKG
ncbi:hypothetical protein [Rubellimicrobium arenae]|uniref:hypothetical protein n=1 Tax=Rubellimicrobium arenae TaxID=2817372 RepID=UPI001B30DA2A|nr:hypothetical protein [Rubellimicrobium arenae]